MKYRIPKLKVRMVREGHGANISHPTAAAEAVRALCCDDPAIETMVVLFVDGLNNIRGASVVGQGGRNSLCVTAAEVLRPALIAGAQGIILGHNHPSGRPLPSAADDALTRAVSHAASVVGVPLLDHIIVTDCASEGFYSYLEEGTLP